MPDNINEKIKEQYDHDNSGGSLNTNQSDFLDSESASGNSINTQWRNWAEGTGTSLNTRLFHKHGGSGSFNTRWKNWIAFGSTHSFNFDGSNDYLLLPSDDNFGVNDTWSVSFWFKSDSISTTQGLFSASKAPTPTNRIGINLHGSVVKFSIYGTFDSTTEYRSKSSTSLSSDTWYHLVATNSNGTLGLYINNVEQTGNSTYSVSHSARRVIGSAINFNLPFNGLIDEFAIWDTALSASDVTSIYNNGKIVDLSKSASYGTDRTANLKLWLRCGDKVEPETSIARSDFYTDFDGTNDEVVIKDYTGMSIGGSDFSITAWVNFSVLTNDGGYTGIVYNGEAGSSNGHLGVNPTNYIIGGTGNGTTWVTVEATASEGRFTTTGTWHHIAMVRENNVIYLYKDGVMVKSGSHSVTPDALDEEPAIGRGSSGAEYFNGAISNVGIYKTALPAINVALMAKSRYTPMRDNRFSVVDFDGSDDLIKVDADSSINSLFATGGTLSGWINTKSVGETAGRIANKGFFFYVHVASGSTCKLGFNIPFSTTGGAWTTTNHDINFNEWQHIAITYDGSSVSSNPIIYINGISVAVTEATTPVGSISDDTADLYIGNRSATDRSFEGSMSSIALHSTAKSAEEVYAIYQQGITYDESSLSGLQGYWRMGDDTSKVFPTIADSSSNSNDGTMTSMASDDIVQQMISGYDMGAFESTGEELGGEEVVNGTFDSNTNSWDVYLASRGDLTWSSGRARIDNTTGTGNQFLRQTGQGRVFKQGVIYKVQFDHHVISEGSNGSSRLNFYWDSNQLIDVYDTTNKQGDTWTIYSVPNADKSHFLIGGFYLGDIYEIDNVTIKEVLQSDLSDTYPAIIDVNEPVLGAELFSAWTNGNTGFGAYPAYDSFSFSNGVLNIAGTGSTANMTVWEDISLVANTVYKITYSVSGAIGGGNSSYFRFAFATKALETSLSVFNEQNTLQSDGDKIIYVQATSTATGYYGFRSANQPNLTISNFSIKAVSGNVGTMTQMDGVSNLVYSSVLPDQSFLTGVNSAYNFIDLDGADQYIDCGDGTSLDTTSQLTLSSWVNFDSTGTNVILARDDNTNSNYILYGWSDGKIYAQIQISGVGKTVDGGSYSSDTWYHVVVTFDGSSLKIYVDADLKDTLSASGSIDNDDVSLEIGRKGNNAFHFDGQIGQTAIWNKSLSSTEVGAIYNLGRHGNLLDSYSDNLVGNWAMSSLDSATGLSDSISTVYDRSGNSNHGTPTNADAGDLASSPNAEPNGYSSGDTNRSTTTP